MQPTITLVDTEVIFKESDWIGVNKKYQDVPPEVSDARNAVLQVPELQPTNFLTLLNTRPLKVNNSGFDLSPIDMVIFNELKKGKAQLKMAMKAQGGTDTEKRAPGSIFFFHQLSLD